MSVCEQILLLGTDYPDYREVELRTQRWGKSACALTVGADPLSPSRLHKARSDVPNEDGLLLVDAGARTLLAVADGHHGHEASHGLLRRLASATRDRLPDNPLELLETVFHCADAVDDGSPDGAPDGSPDPENPAASSLLVAVFDRDSGTGFGSSFGDSTLAVIRRTESADSWNDCAANFRNTQFVSPRFAESLDPRRAVEFAFRTATSDVVVAFTDGVDGCHYGFPATSVAPLHLGALWVRAEGEVAGFVGDAMELALSGVGSHPGGQDNIAMVAVGA